MSHATHANAALTPRARLRLARLIVEGGWSIPRAAERYDVSWKTAKKWADRYKIEGSAGMADRSSRPHSQPNRTPAPVVRKIVHLRWKQRLGPVEIGGRHAQPVARKVLDLMQALQASIDAARSGHRPGNANQGKKRLDTHQAEDEDADGSDNLSEITKTELYDLAQDLDIPGPHWPAQSRSPEQASRRAGPVARAAEPNEAPCGGGMTAA